MKRAARYAAAIALAAAAAWAGARFHAGLTAPVRSGGLAVPAGQTSPQSAADRAAALADTNAAEGIRIPDRLPQFTLNDLDGKPTSIAAWSGKSLIINFWATWCAPCRREIPLLKTLHGRRGLQNFAVVGIAVDHRDEVAKFASDFHIHYPLLYGDQDALDVASALGVASPAFPFTVFTDRRGRIVTLYLGELHAPQIQLILGVVQNINNDQVGLSAARRAIDDGLGRLKSAGAAT